MTDPLRTASEELQRLEVFVDICERGLGFATRATWVIDWTRHVRGLLGEPDPFQSPDSLATAKERASALEAFARQEVEAGHPYLYHIAVIKLWGILENAVDSVVKERLLKGGSSLRSDLLLSIKGPLLDFLRMSPDDQAGYLTDQLKLTVSASLKPGSGRFEAILAPVDLGGPVDDAIRRILLELQQVRHCCVHKAAKADERLREACPWVPAPLGAPLRLTRAHFHTYLRAAYWYLLELRRRREVSRGHTDNLQEIDDVKKEITTGIGVAFAGLWAANGPAEVSSVTSDATSQSN